MPTICFATLDSFFGSTIRTAMIADGLIVVMLVFGVAAVLLGHTQTALAAHVLSRVVGVIAVAGLVHWCLRWLPTGKKINDDFGSDFPAMAQLVVDSISVLLTRWCLAIALGAFAGEAILFNTLHKKNTAYYRLLARTESAFVTILMACIILVTMLAMLVPFLKIAEDIIS